MRNCPFCKQKIDDVPRYNTILRLWILSHYCDGVNAVTIDVYGETEQEVIDKWNGEYEEHIAE